MGCLFPLIPDSIPFPFIAQVPTVLSYAGSRPDFISAFVLTLLFSQVEVLRRLRKDPNNQRLRDALLISINGIAAGMRNTG